MFWPPLEIIPHVMVEHLYEALLLIEEVGTTYLVCQAVCRICTQVLFLVSKTKSVALVMSRHFKQEAINNTSPDCVHG